MSFFHDIEKRFKLVWPQVIAAACVAYFAYHTIEGEHGFWSLIRLKQSAALKEAERDRVALAHAELEKKVRLLRSDSLDLDMLEERARIVLNYGRKQDIIIPLSQAFSEQRK